MNDYESPYWLRTLYCRDCWDKGFISISGVVKNEQKFMSYCYDLNDMKNPYTFTQYCIEYPVPN